MLSHNPTFHLLCAAILASDTDTVSNLLPTITDKEELKQVASLIIDTGSMEYMKFFVSPETTRKLESKPKTQETPLLFDDLLSDVLDGITTKDESKIKSLPDKIKSALQQAIKQKEQPTTTTEESQIPKFHPKPQPKGEELPPFGESLAKNSDTLKTIFIPELSDNFRNMMMTFFPHLSQ